MGSRARHPATVAALSHALPGCDSADHAAPDEGTCWTVLADDAVDRDHWFDDSSKVPCTGSHTSGPCRCSGWPIPPSPTRRKCPTACFMFDEAGQPLAPLG